MTLGLYWNAVRRHPFSMCVTALLVTVSASLVGASAPLALLLWVLGALLGLHAWHTLESFALRRLGCRPPSHLERERLILAPTSAGVDIQVLDVAEPWLGIGLHSLVVTRALLDLLDDRALVGLLAQATERARSGCLPGELVVWLGNLPLLGVWRFGRWLVDLGRLLAVVVGAALVLPMILCPTGFTRWAGRVFGAVIVGLFGSALLASRLAAPGLGLLLAWALVPAVAALLARERRRAEIVADDATIAAGLGWHLLEGLETLAWAESLPRPAGPLGLLCPVGAPITDRADRLWRLLSAS